MKSLFTLSTATVLIAVLVVSANANADELSSRANRRASAGQLDKKTTGSTIRASQMIGMNIQNTHGEGVGEIQDIVLDAESGEIKYVAVTYGGFLGLGNKLFAVPYEAFKCRPNPEDADETVVVLDVTQKQLEGAKGFDEDHWPNFADTKFTAELDRRYKVTRPNQRFARDRDVDVDVNRSRVGSDVRSNRKREE